MQSLEVYRKYAQCFKSSSLQLQLPVNMFPSLDEGCGGSNEADSIGSIDEACSPLTAEDVATSTETQAHEAAQVPSYCT